MLERSYAAFTGMPRDSFARLPVVAVGVDGNIHIVFEVVTRLQVEAGFQRDMAVYAAAWPRSRMQVHRENIPKTRKMATNALPHT